MGPEKPIRKLVAILCAGAEGYSRLMGKDEAATLQTFKGYRQAMCSLIEKHQGRVVDSPGGSLLAMFDSAAEAVQCAIEIQEQLRALNEVLPEAGRIPLRIGVHLGEVTEEEGKVRGDGVHVAALLEGMADAGGICISGGVYGQMKGRLKAEYESLGEHRLPDIAEPVHAYRVLKKPEKSIHVFGKTWLLSHLETRLDIIKVIVLAMSVLVGIAGLWNTYFRSAPPPAGVASVQRMALPLPDKPSIAVLPFENMTGDPKQEYFADGFTEQIITSLSKITGLFVIARNSSFTYKGKPVKVQQVSEELGVRYVLEGSIQKSGTRVRINAQLIDAVSGKHLWAEHYDRQLKDIFALQDEIILKILTALQVNLTAGEQARVWAKGTKNLDAYLKLMQVRENVFRMNRESNVRARQLAEETIALDPKYAEAYSWMGATYYLEVFYGLSKSPKDSLAQAVEWERKALAIDNSLALAYARLGYTYSLMKRHEEGIAALEKAVVMDPNAALTHQFLGAALRFAGRPEEAILEIKQAIRLEPFTPGIYYMNLGLSYLLKGDCEEAVKACEKGLERERDNLLSYIMATAVYGSCGRDEAARRTAKEILRLNPKFSTESSAKKLPYKNPKDLDQVLEGLRKAGLP